MGVSWRSSGQVYACPHDYSLTAEIRPRDAPESRTEPTGVTSTGLLAHQETSVQMPVSRAKIALLILLSGPFPERI